MHRTIVGVARQFDRVEQAEIDQTLCGLCLAQQQPGGNLRHRGVRHPEQLDDLALRGLVVDDVAVIDLADDEGIHVDEASGAETVAR